MPQYDADLVGRKTAQYANDIEVGRKTLDEMLRELQAEGIDVNHIQKIQKQVMHHAFNKKDLLDAKLQLYSGIGILVFAAIATVIAFRYGFFFIAGGMWAIGIGLVANGFVKLRRHK